MPRPTRPKRPRRSSRKARAATPAPVRQPAVIYARVSSREQEREGYSIPAQLDLLRAYADKNNLDVLEEYVDVETAKRTGRTNFTKMMSRLRKAKGTPPVVLVEKTDRLYRNLKDWISVDALKVAVHLVKEGVVLSEDSRSSEKFIHGIKVLMAKNYVDNLSEEVKKGLTQKACDGHWPSAAPVGYVNRRENGRGRIALDPDKAMLIRSLFELYDTGDWSLQKLSRYAKEVGLRGGRGGQLYASSVRTILRNPLYAGKFYWADELYEGKDPKLISWELYMRVQDRMDGNTVARPRCRQFAYGGLITCGHCGAAITMEIKKEKYIYYRCSQLCEAKAYVREEVIHRQYLEIVGKLQMSDALAKTLGRHMREQQGIIEDDIRAKMTAAHRRLDRLGRLIEAAYEDKLEGRITAEFFQEKREGWERQRREAARDIERLTRVSAKTMDQAVALVELSRRAYDVLSRRPPLEQAPMLELLLSNSFLTGDRLTVEWREPFGILASRPDGEGGEFSENGGGEGGCTKWLDGCV